MAKATVESSLKAFGLTDDQILEVACTRTLGDSASLLREYIWDKWNMTTLEAMQISKKLKEELQ